MTITRHTITLGALAALVLTLAGCSAGGTATELLSAETSATTSSSVSGITTSSHEPGAELQIELDQIAPSELTEDEIDGLLWMREEEKLAHDVYVTLFGMWGLRPFSTIAQSEQTHTDAVVALLDRYGLEDPADANTVGVFTDPTIQGLYDDLVAQGSESAEAALTVGVMIEELDIVDLQQRATYTEDIALVYANLEKGSRNHLRAFMRNLDRYDVEYEPQFMPADEFDAIAGSANENGPSDD
jgi:hypothetical protein